MIRGPDQAGVAFSQSSDGDQRHAENRLRFSTQAEAPSEWAMVHQVHGNVVHRVDQAGVVDSDGDALWTSEPELTVSVLTADCFGVVMGSGSSVGVAHAGWRGVEAGVVTELRKAMADAGAEPVWAAIGPGIGSCCFEVGPEVGSRFGGFTDLTSWGTPSVDLRSAIEAQLAGLKHWSVESCTYSDTGWFSHRRDATPMRLATIAWLS